MTNPALLWFLAGLALVMAEFVVPGVILVFFGLGAWITALTTYVGLTVGTEAQLWVFAGSSTLSLVILRRLIRDRFYGHVSEIQNPSVNLDEFTGRLVEVTEDIEPGQSEGQVEFKGAPWRARAAVSIKRGEAAVIDRVEGTVLIIRKAEEV